MKLKSFFNFYLPYLIGMSKPWIFHSRGGFLEQRKIERSCRQETLREAFFLKKNVGEKFQDFSIFLTAVSIWLTYGQLWVITERAASFTQCC